LPIGKYIMDSDYLPIDTVSYPRIIQSPCRYIFTCRITGLRFPSGARLLISATSRTLENTVSCLAGTGSFLWG